MKILSHRGYWKAREEKNTVSAFERSFSKGFGTETDIRDFNGRIVISHDIATGLEIDFTTFLELNGLNSTDKRLPLALNIKADGLAESVLRELKARPELDCFVFDMSVPDMRSYFEAGVPVFTRMSEVEQQPVWLERAAGVWLDGFESEWYDETLIEGLLRKGKRVCIVSPELHGRNQIPLWQRIETLAHETNLMLCTDYPELAYDYFLNK